MSSQVKSAEPVGGKTADKVFKGVAYACGILILVVLAAVAVFLLFRAWPLIGGDQQANSETISNFTGGKASNFWTYVGPLLFGTVLVSALSLIIAFFVSIGIALFISHYAPKNLATVLSYVVDLLAAIPSVIYGLWGGLVLVPAIFPFWNWVATYLGWIPLFAGPAANPSRTVATVSVVLAVMILPIITSLSRDIFLQTPRLQEEAALALGATRWEMIKLAVLPFGASIMPPAWIAWPCDILSPGLNTHAGLDVGYYFLKGLSQYGNKLEDNLDRMKVVPIQTGFKFERSITGADSSTARYSSYISRKITNWSNLI